MVRGLVVFGLDVMLDRFFSAGWRRLARAGRFRAGRTLRRIPEPVREPSWKSLRRCVDHPLKNMETPPHDPAPEVGLATTPGVDVIRSTLFTGCHWSRRFNMAWMTTSSHPERRSTCNRTSSQKRGDLRQNQGMSLEERSIVINWSAARLHIDQNPHGAGSAFAARPTVWSVAQVKHRAETDQEFEVEVDLDKRRTDQLPRLQNLNAPRQRQRQRRRPALSVLVSTVRIRGRRSRSTTAKQ